MTFVLAASGWLLCSCGSEDGGQSRDAGRRLANIPGELTVKEVTPLQVEASLKTVDALPAARGSLADCNLLLVTLDTTRADRIGCYGNQQIETPTLDQMAREGVLFSAATAVTPTTMPSHASIHTGLYPVHHGVRSNGFFRLDARHETLAERLKAEGFRTGAIVSAFVLDSQFGLSQGFDHFDDDLSDTEEVPGRHFRSRNAGPTTDRAIAWLRGASQERFFLWVHYFDPHRECSPPSPFAEQYADRLYDGEIAYVDSELKRLLDALDELGLTEKCLVVVVGDHGEGLGQHQEVSHSYLVYESTLRVPFLMRCGSRLGGGVHCPRPVSHVDVMPSVLSLLGLDPGPGDGVAATTSLAADRPIFFETLTGSLEFGWEALVGVTSGSYKYIHSSAPELYDLASDPGENDNLYSTDRPRAEALSQLLPGLFGTDLDHVAQVTPTVQPSADDLEDLQALGYVAGGSVNDGTSSPEGRPQEMIWLLTQVNMARNASVSPQKSVATLTALLRDHADFYPAWMALASVHLENEELAPAAEAFSQCLRLKPGVPKAAFALAGVRVSQHRPDQALIVLEPLVQDYPGYHRARYLLAVVLSSLDRWPEAADHYKAVFESDPGYKDCLTYLVGAFVRSNRATELGDILRQRLSIDPAAVDVRLELAKHLSKRKQDQVAASLLRTGLSIHPGDPGIIHRLALLQVSSTDPAVRDPAAAISLLQPFAQEGAEDPSLMYLLCAAHADAGQMKLALAVGTRARELALKKGDARLVNALDQQLNKIVPSADGNAVQK